MDGFCPRCGARQRVLFRTAIVDGIRVPIEPFRTCPAGHVQPMRRVDTPEASKRPGPGAWPPRRVAS